MRSEETVEEPGAAGRWETALFVSILLLAAFLRFETLSQRPLWADELFVWRAVAGSGGLADVWRWTAVEDAANPPLHLLVSYGALRISESVTALRFPSVLCGLLALGLVMVLGARLFDRRTGLVAGLLMAISVYQINYAQDGRPYALLLALTAAQYLSFVSYLERPRPAPLVAFTLVGAASLYTHHLAVVTQVSIALFAAFWWWASFRKSGEAEATPFAPFASKQALDLALAYLGMFLLFGFQLAHLFQYLSSPVLGANHVLAPSPRLFHELFARWGGGRGPVSYLYDAAFVLGLFFLLRGGRRGRMALVLLPCFVAPFLVFSLVPFSKFFDIRFLIQAYPAFVLLAASGLVQASRMLGERLHGRLPGSMDRGLIAGSALVIFLVGIGVPNLAAYWTFRQTEHRCSAYPRTPRLLFAHDGFCRNHILLSTVLSADRFLVRPSGKDPEGTMAVRDEGRTR